VIAVVAVTAYVGLMSWAAAYASYDVWAALVVGSVLVAATVPLMAAATGRETDRRIKRLLVAAFVVKLGAALAYLMVVEEQYGGVADVGFYDEWARRLLPALEAGEHAAAVEMTPDGQALGIWWIVYLTGLVYRLTGPSVTAASLLFSWFGFWGLYFAYRAFCCAFPDGDRLRYARLVLLLPSLVYWSSAIGKDAWMMFWIGLAAWGIALITVGAHRGFPALFAGLAGTAVVRPHIAVLILTATAVGYLLQRSPRIRTAATPVWKIGGLLLLLTGFFIAAVPLRSLFGLDGIDAGSLNSLLDRARAQSTWGNSEFQGEPVQSVQDVPFAVVTVLFRPFPWEAHSALALLATLEGMLILALLWRRRRGLLASILAARTRGYFLVAVSYILLFCVAFSTMGNFGLLVRQRIQVLPFLLILLALPPARRGKTRSVDTLVTEPRLPTRAPV
jgi:hypothetical protein